MTGRILLTGFEPFGEDQVNPSWEVAGSLDGVEVLGFQISSRLLPVEWGVAGDKLEAFIEEVDPVIILSLGLASGRAEVSVEKVAINYQGKARDNKGNIGTQSYIIQNGPDAYFASVPVEEIVDELVKGGIPARLSLSAGAYLCNYTFYRASHYVKQTGRNARVGFIHLPATPQMVAGRPRSIPSMDLGLERDACLKALNVIARFLTNCG